MDIRAGHGFDTHAITSGNSVVLCNVQINADFALVGHSDADVALHALTDALLGAIAANDIGDHFPDNDPANKGRNSAEFLLFAVNLVKARGFSIANADVTIICERPRISAHRDQMRSRLAELLKIDISRVNVKGKTTEQLGFTGRGEGIAALATVLITSG